MILSASGLQINYNLRFLIILDWASQFPFKRRVQLVLSLRGTHISRDSRAAANRAHSLTMHCVCYLLVYPKQWKCDRHANSCSNSLRVRSNRCGVFKLVACRGSMMSDANFLIWTPSPYHYCLCTNFFIGCPPPIKMVLCRRAIAPTPSSAAHWLYVFSCWVYSFQPISQPYYPCPAPIFFPAPKYWTIWHCAGWYLVETWGQVKSGVATLTSWVAPLMNYENWKL